MPVKQSAKPPASLSAAQPGPRSSYRHGDLRRALLDAGLALAAEGGPGAVVLREATRRAGVAPNAAYRHFANREALLQAVRDTALGEVARAMEAHLKKVPKDLAPADKARAGLRAVGRGYMRFAQAQPGMFKAAFSASDVLREPPAAERAGESGLSPYKLLAAALDGLLDAGLLPPERRPGAEVLAWSAVHGLALLVIDGPMAKAVGPRMKHFEERLLDMVDKGLAG